MRKALTTAADETYGDHLNDPQAETAWTGFDGWLTAVRAFFLLIGGMLLISLLTVI